MKVAFLAMEAAGGAFFGAVWLASVVWTARDAGRRCDDRSLGVASTAAAILLPLVGAGLYALARPCEERLDVKARRLRMQMLETAFREDQERCSVCAAPLEPEFRCCPVCAEPLRRECGGCGALLRPTWVTCPWCAASPVKRDERQIAAA